MSSNVPRRQVREEAVSYELDALPELTRPELIGHWKAAFGRLPPKAISRRLLEYSAAYVMQVNALGGLSPSVSRRLNQASGKREVAARSPTSLRQKLPAGTRLVRDWHGATHVVDVVESGYRYAGREYRSLSEIAREITGTRWSGPRFFGL